jgi:2-polyprenyl-3-methyl-5-hydroxy-6-metoxy-1,4-benzoquinol methylase
MSSTTEAVSIETVDVQTCYLCGSDGERLHANLRDLLFGASGVWNVFRCPRCELAWLSPRPRRKEIHKLYQQYHTHAIPSEGHEDARESLGRLARNAALRRFCGYDSALVASRLRGLLAETLCRLGPVRDAAAGSVMWLAAARRGRLLDVGCGNGSFLAHMKDLGWDVKGVERDPVAANAGRSEFGLDITTAPLEEANLPSNTFDVITASHVLEHVHDPVGFLRECGRLLRRGGAIVVVTPNSRSLGSRWFGSSWRGWEVPRHFFVFTPMTLRTCAERAGLQIDELRTTARSAREIWHSSRVLKRPLKKHSKDVWQQFLAVSFWFVEHVTARAIPSGEEVLLVGRRS